MGTANTNARGVTALDDATASARFDALSPCVVLEATVGSRAWGLDNADSDTDTRGVFALPTPWSFGLAEPPRDLRSDDGCQTYWELSKAVQQGLRGDPNTLEMLFVKDVRLTDEVGAWLYEARDAFVSRAIYGSFGRYALSQLKRLAQSLRLAEHREVVLEWLREEPLPPLDEVASRLALRVAEGTPEERTLRAKEYVKELYRSLRDRGIVEARDYGALVKLARDSGHAFEAPRTLRPKNAYNLLRLLRAAIDWLETGTPQLRVADGPFRERLLAIKAGEVLLDDVLAEANELLPQLEEARRRSPLPEKPDVARADALVRRAGLDLARRYVQGAAGPFGSDAAMPTAADGEGATTAGAAEEP